MALKSNRLVALSETDRKKKRYTRLDQQQWPEQEAIWRPRRPRGSSMSTERYTHRLIILLGLLVVVLSVAGCGAQAAEPAVEPAANVLPEGATIPDGVMQARETVLAYLRDGANECVPPEIARWSATDRSASAPAGFDVYHFESGGCSMTITTPAASTEAPIYHVALGDGASGFCWQSVGDEHGKIVLTGEAAQTDHVLGNPAKAYCESEGHTFEVRTLANGSKCGVCAFEDGRTCNAWAFFHGACTPENAPASD
jgi:putative hemolysin